MTGLPTTLRFAVENLVVAKHAQREHVHQRIAVVALFEDALAADRRHAEAVAVMRDAGNHALENSAIARHVQRAESQRVHYGDRPRSHGKDVTQNSADAGGRALKRLDETGMVVRFDLERDRVPVADVDDAGVLAGTLQNPLAARRKFLQMQARAFVRAMLAPHHAEDAELGIGGFAAEQRDDFLVLRRRQLVGFDDLRASCVSVPSRVRKPWIEK